MEVKLCAWVEASLGSRTSSLGSCNVSEDLSTTLLKIVGIVVLQLPRNATERHFRSVRDGDLS